MINLECLTPTCGDVTSLQLYGKMFVRGLDSSRNADVFSGTLQLFSFNKIRPPWST